MKLKQPETATAVFHRDLSPDMAYLADGAIPYITISSKVGGYLNPDLMNARDKLDLRRRVAAMELADKAKLDYVAAMDKTTRTDGEDRFAAIYDFCVTEWKTNIIDDASGEAIEANKDNFLGLAGVRVPEIAAAFTAFARYVDDVANYVRKADEETEKN